MYKDTTITLGSRSQSHTKYGMSAGKQCTGMSLAFSVYSETYDVLSTKRRDIDNILDLGNNIYEACSSYFEVEILAGDELPTDITYDGVRYKVARGRMRYGFLDDFHNLTYQVTNVFCNYKQAFFICKGYTVMIKYANGYYFLFDSHKKDKFGRKHADGKASVMRFKNFSEMLKYLANLFKSTTREQYDVVPIQIEKELCKSGISADIRCHFRRRRGNVARQHESDVMQISSDDSYLSQNDNSQTTFRTYRKRKSPWTPSTEYEPEMQEAKRLKQNVATCVLGPGNTVVYVDDDCSDRHDSFATSGSEAPEYNEPKSQTRKKVVQRRLRLKKIGSGWCIVKDASNPVLKQRDRGQIEVIKCGLSFPHGTVVTLLKENGLWSLENPSMNLSQNRGKENALKQNSNNVMAGMYTVPMNSDERCSKSKNVGPSRQSVPKQSLDSSKENVNPDLHVTDVKLSHAARKQRAYREKQKAKKSSCLETDTASIQENSQPSTPDLTEEFLPSNVKRQRSYRARKKAIKLELESDPYQINSQNSTQESGITQCFSGNAISDGKSSISATPRPLSMTSKAIRQRAYRARKKLCLEKSAIDPVACDDETKGDSQQSEIIMCSSGNEISDGESSISGTPRPLSMTPGAIYQREHRARKKLKNEKNDEACEKIIQAIDKQKYRARKKSENERNSEASKSMTPNAIRLRNARLRKKTEDVLADSTSEDDANLGIRNDQRRRNRDRNYRISKRKTPLYQAPVFQNNDWSVNNHYGNPCESVITGYNNILVNDFSLEVPNDLCDVSNDEDNEILSEVQSSTRLDEEQCSTLLDQDRCSILLDEAQCSEHDDDDENNDHVNSPLIDFGVADQEHSVDTESMNVDIISSKVFKLNESVDNVCVFCTKLCFSEQGKYYCGIYLEKYKIYLDPNFSEDRAFVCNTCNGQIKKRRSPTFNKYNGIHWPSKVPELDIFPHEERLIALRLPFMHIQILPSGGQHSLKGNVINVPADIHETIFMLPRHLNDQGTVSVKLKRRLCYRAVYEDSNVRPVNVLQALQYLKTNSSYYQQSSLQVSDTWLGETIQEIEHSGNMPLQNDQIDSDIENSLPPLNDLTGCGRTNANVTNPDADDEAENRDSDDRFSEVDRTEIPAIHDTMLDIIPRNVYLNVAPGEGQRPLHLLYDKNGEEMSFPTIYCGKAIDEIFPENFNFLQRTRWELTTEDRRLANRTEPIFYKYKMYQLDYIREQGKLALRCLKNDKQYTAKDLRTDEQRQNIATVDDGFFFYRKLRNSPQYLQQKKRELFATIRQLGIPTFFVSLSAADTKWQELLQSLGKIVDGKCYSFEEIENMSFNDRTRLINSDPVTCARYFDRRFQFFLKHILYKHPYPLGRITDHFYRIEFQHRGSPHVHMIIFSESAPKYKKNEDNTRVIEYIDRYISCSLEPREEAKPYINYQVHKHSKTCRKGGRPTCRFNYPLPPFDRTLILQPNSPELPEKKMKYVEIQNYLDSNAITENTTLDDILQHFNLTYEEYEVIVRSTIKRDHVFLKRKPSECRVNMYMRNLLHIWKANMDCQFCLDPYSVVSYIVNYINKDNRGLSLNLATVTRQCESEKKSIRETIKKLGNVFLNTSEISVHECVYVLMGLALTHQSVDVLLVNTSVEERRVKLVKHQSELVSTNDDSSDIFQDSQYDKYAKRHLYFKDWTFADYIAMVKILPRTERSKQVECEGLHFTRLHTRYVLDANKRYSIGRRRILSFLCPPKSQDEEQYFRIHLLLFHPWTVEPKTNQTNRTYKSMYLLLSQSEIDDLHENARVYTKQSLHALQEMYESLTNDISNLVVAPGADQMNSEDIALGAVSLCHGNFFNPTRQVLDDTGSGSCEHAVNAQQETVNSLWSSEELSERVVNLNKGQRYIFDHVISEIIHGENTLRLFITGGAGSGKTFVLHAINEAVSRYFNLQPSNIPSIKSVMKVAITGKAAFLIKGETIHSGLGIRPKKCYEFYERLSADQLNSLHVKFRGTKLLMIDEISMVGLNFFRFINARLQDIMANDEPFGGLNIICFGDLYQLPPVHDKWIFDDNENGLSSLEINMWKEHFMLYELKEIMRQRDEYEFAELLNRMRVGQMIPSDFDCLQRQAVPVHVSNDNLDCLHLFSTNDAATDYNQICFNKSDGEKEQVLAVDSIVEVVTPHVKSLVIAELNKTNMRSGVLRCLDLAIGLTYEITQNLNVQDGLFNGTSGILKFIQYREGYEKPIALWLELEEEMIGQTQRRIYSHYRTPEIPNLWTPVFAVSREFKIKDPKVTIRRKQFPIHQCTGKTIHRAQGCTVPEIAIQLSDFTHRNGFYVACSRVPKLRNLHILNFAPNQILTDKKVGHEMERLRTERLLNLEVDIYPRKDMWFSVYYCNVQSLIRHISYVRRDFMALSSNLILFNETHLTNDDSDFLVNIDGFKIYRFDCEVTDTGRRPYNGLVLYTRCFFDVNVVTKYRSERFEYLCCEIVTNWNKLTVVLVYVKPPASRADLTNMFEHIFQNDLDFNRNIALIGDLNFNTLIPENFSFLHDLAEDYNLMLNHTTITTNKGTIIDHCLSNNPSSVSCRFIPWSYHNALTCQF